MSTKSTESEMIEFLICVISHCPDFKPDYHTVANDLSINTAHNAQRRFKTIVENGGQYKLAGKKITKVDKSATPKKIKKNTTAAEATPTKKRKVKAVDEEDDLEQEE